MKLIDLTGQRFGRLVVIEKAPRDGTHSTKWVCKCDCGNIAIVRGEYMKNGTTKSCGCYNEDVRSMKHYIHGLTQHPIWRTYHHILSRCYNERVPKYNLYGGRGIVMCDEWKNDFMSFYNWSILNGWKPGLSIDRIDNDGNYCPENCRWADDLTQQNNRGNNKNLTYNGKTQTMSQWAREFNMSISTLYYRIKHGWSVEDALLTPVGGHGSTGRF